MPSPCPHCRVGSAGSPVRWAPPLWPRGNILEGRPLHPGQRVGSASSLPAARTGPRRQGRQKEQHAAQSADGAGNGTAAAASQGRARKWAAPHVPGPSCP